MVNLRSIVYASTAVREYSEVELAELLVEVRDLNLETGTTGVLLYSGGTFMQCFEGSEEASAITYERILKSRKHLDITELINESVQTREFADWQMGYRRVARDEVLALSTARWDRRQRDAGDGPGAAHGMVLLKHFWKLAQR